MESNVEKEIQKEDIRKIVDQIFVEQFELDPAVLAPEKKLNEDFGLDSLDAIDLVIRFEQAFDSKPSNEELMAIVELNDVYKLAEKYYDLSK